MSDITETVRRVLVNEINTNATGKEHLEEKYGQVWSTSEMTAEFEVSGFLAPYVSVRRRSDGQRGSLMFQHSPRFYFSFEPRS